MHIVVVTNEYIKKMTTSDKATSICLLWKKNTMEPIPTIEPPAHPSDAVLVMRDTNREKRREIQCTAGSSAFPDASTHLKVSTLKIDSYKLCISAVSPIALLILAIFGCKSDTVFFSNSMRSWLLSVIISACRRSNKRKTHGRVKQKNN